MHPSAPRTHRKKLAAALLTALAAGAMVLQGLQAPGAPAQVHQAQSLLEHVRASRAVPADPGLGLPPIPEVGDPTHRKTLFIAALLPSVVRENARIADQRARAQSAPADSPEYAALAYAYGLGPGAPRETLLRRIDIVPTSLALAQGAIESAWGTSRFARDGNAYFGERTYDIDAEGLAPGQAKPNAVAFKVKSFPSAALSVRSFMKTLNTHPAYRALRERRAALRQAGRRPTGLALAPYLHGYSEIGDAYVRRVVVTIRTNGLAAYNGLQLHGE